MGKYSEQFKLTVVKAYLEDNMGFRMVARQFSIDFSLLRRWVANYKSHGHTGHRKPGLRYSEAFKRSVLEHRREHKLSLRQAAAHFGIGDPGQIVIWEKRHYSSGTAPYVPARRKPVAMPKKPYPAKPVTADDTQKTRDQLMSELEYLRMENAYPKKVGRAEGAETTATEKALSIKQLRGRFPLCALLRLAGLARSTFYYQVQVQSRPDPYAALKQLVESIYHEEKGLYGARRITAVIRTAGILVNKKVVERLMAELGLRSVVRPKKYRSYKGVIGTIAPNLLERNFSAQRPNQKWVTDVTEFKVGNRKLYLSPVMDLYNGEIVAYEVSTRPSFELVTSMLDKALQQLQDEPKLVMHSDQGWQYQHAQYRHKLSVRGVKQSMSRKGNCLDNAAMESFFGTLKSEFFYLKQFESIDELKAGLDEYIHYYNHDRIKLKLNGQSPVKYRAQAAS
ncbi:MULTISPECIES: IS3 family transposase [Pseudomonas]|uniref:IS3 family transposase n=4 Tax=Pseudomonas syringae group genomosp. 2 TaxID=251698 RepID=A0AB73QV51_PSESS|nr:MULTISPECIES: IS3 family transposase [Pseudomonas]MBA4703407.1 IS3 family transposase [Pseudomonas savastanoi pv. savastanoi]MCQ3024271.1 IS3 family transposase [Pseudomonas savastanoi]PAB24694.1 IS3 family transposase [Pseudomonas savastanoi]PAB25061.1 IS3 family transposase [Pseudomonas savastanoi pv. nerii]PAB35475.1 IS3 family transposase [Pseudomonas savastanoi pv. fraxini]